MEASIMQSDGWETVNVPGMKYVNYASLLAVG